MKKIIITLFTSIILIFLEQMTIFADGAKVIDDITLTTGYGKVVIKSISETNDKGYKGYNSLELSFYGEDLNHGEGEETRDSFDKIVIKGKDNKLYLQLIGVKVINIPIIGRDGIRRSIEGVLITYSYDDEVATPKSRITVVEIYGLIDGKCKKLWAMVESSSGGGAGYVFDDINCEYAFKNNNRQILVKKTTSKHDNKTHAVIDVYVVNEEYNWNNSEYIKTTNR